MLETIMPKINKKSKYQSLLINKKRYYFYKITWLDIVGDSGHATLEEFMKLTPAVMISYGYIFSKDKNYIRSFEVMIVRKKHLVIEMFIQLGV